MTKISKNNLYIIIGVLAVAVALPFILPMNNYWMNILASFCYFSIAASSLNLLLGYTGQVSTGHNAFMCIGAYSYGIFTVNFKFPGSQVIGLLLGIAIPFLFGLLIGVGCSRLSAVFLAMATGAFAKALKSYIIFHEDLTGGANGLTGIPKMSLAAVTIPNLLGMSGKIKMEQYNQILYFFLLAATAIVILFCWRLINSKTGRAFQAIKTSPIAASSMGVNVAGYKLLVCGISAAMAGLAGVFYTWNITYLSADTFDKMGVKLMTMAVAGGMSTIPGPIIGAVIMGYIPELLRAFGMHLEGIYGLLIIVVFLLIPSGIYGSLISLVKWVQTKFKKSSNVVTKEEQ